MLAVSLFVMCFFLHKVCGTHSFSDRDARDEHTDMVALRVNATQRRVKNANIAKKSDVGILISELGMDLVR